MRSLTYSISCTIRKPLHVIFQAIIDPNILVTYFPNASSGIMEDGAHLVWTWESQSVDFYVDRVIPNERIESHWEGYGVDYMVNTVFEFRSLDEGTTVVTISESSFRDDEAGRAASYAQCSGWTEMLLFLKARLQFNIDLR